MIKYRFYEVKSIKQGALGAICNCEAKRLCGLTGCEAGTSGRSVRCPQAEHKIRSLLRNGIKA